ncbi:MscL family protein [Candidatus Uhrbacteria bacterium]|nr:MscL family protein [Candidatus Uhrbacteria bacterium]
MFVKEFFVFLREYKVMTLAIAFVMGTATDTLVKSLVNNLVMPFFGPLLTTGWRESLVHIGPFAFGIGAFVADALYFVILAFVIFLVVKRIMKLDTVPGKK